MKTLVAIAGTILGANVLAIGVCLWVGVDFNNSCMAVGAVNVVLTSTLSIL